jgi:hypothetical protein
MITTGKTEYSVQLSWKTYETLGNKGTLALKREHNFKERTFKAKAEAERKAKENTPPTPPEPPKPNETEKKKGGIGWMLFGAVALVVTMGAVNVMNKK